ncbi:hypothetical protein D3C78_1069660 [compost metagenome]
MAGDFGQAFGRIRIVRFDGCGKLQIAQGVFVGAVDQRVFRQLRETCQRAVHLLWRAFEQPPATGGKQGVAAEQQAVMVIGDMAQGVAGDREDIEVQPEHADALVVLERYVPRRDLFAGRTIDFRVRRFFQLFDPADVVMMVVSDQNITQYPARIGRKPGMYRGGITRVDHRAAFAAVVL